MNILRTFVEKGCVDEDVIPLFFEDLVYRVQELVTNAYQFTKHGKRVKLTCNDINKALSISDTPKIYGYGHDKKPLEDVFCGEAKIWTVGDELVDLVAVSESIINKTYRVNLIAESPQYRIDWIPLGNKVKLEYEQNGTPEHDKFISAFNCITRGILSKDRNNLKATLNGLSCSPNVQHILPHLVKFLSGKIAKGTEIKTIRQLIWAIQALCRNPHIHLTSESHAGPLIASLLHCVLNNSVGDPFLDSFTNDHWTLRYFTSYILCDVLKNWNSSFVYSKVYNQVIRACLEALKDQPAAYSSYYGSLVTFYHLGFDCIMTNLGPYFLSFCNFLIQVIEVDVFSDDLTKTQAYAAFGALTQLSLYLLLKFRENTLKNNFCDSSNLAKEILLLFGDRVSAIMPTCSQEIASKIYSHRPYPEPHSYHQPTGSELLDTFYENHQNFNHDHDESNSSSLESKDDEKSIESEKDLVKHDGADLQVQSTISDPTLGVKLTIKKVRRPRKSIEEIQESAALSQEREAKNIKAMIELFSQEYQELLREEQILRGTRGRD